MADAAQSPTPINPSDDLAQLTKDPVPSLVDEIKQFEVSAASAHADNQQMYNQGGKFKEHLEAIAQKVQSLERSAPIERAPHQVTEIVQHIEEKDLKDTEGYIEKIEKETELATPVIDDYTQQVLLKSANPQDVIVTLPLTADEVQLGLHHKVWEAITWLANWCLRQIKIRPGRVKYRQENNGI